MAEVKLRTVTIAVPEAPQLGDDVTVILRGQVAQIVSQGTSGPPKVQALLRATEAYIADSDAAREVLDQARERATGNRRLWSNRD